MKSLSLSNIPTLDFSTQDRDYLTQQRKDFEYRLQLLSNIQPSDDFNGVRENIVKEDEITAEEDYIQATASNVMNGKMSTENAANLVKTYTSEQFSVDTALEKRATDNLLEELFQDDEEMYAVYANNPEAFQRDYDYTVNSLLVSKLYDDYQISWKSDENKNKYLAEAGTEFVTSWGASWAGFGFPLEATKQGFKINAFKDIIDVKDDTLTPTALGYNLNKAITQNAKEMSPDEFNKWLTDTLKPAIDSLPMIYQTEVLEGTLEGYLGGNNFFLVSDFGDWGRLGKALQKSKGSVDKTVGNFKKALDDVIVKQEEALSATAKPDVTETTVLKNEPEVKKDVVKDVVEEEMPLMSDTVDAEEVTFASKLIETNKIDDISDPVNKSVIDNKSFGEENATLIGRASGVPFTSEEEAIRAARNIIIESIERDGGKLVSAWSKKDYRTPSLRAALTGEGNATFGRGLYYTLQKPFKRSNSSGFYESNFKGYMPDIEGLGPLSPKNISKYAQEFLNNYTASKLSDYGSIESWDNREHLLKLSEEAIERLQRLFDTHRQKGYSIKETLRIIGEDLDREIKSSEKYLEYGDNLEEMHQAFPETYSQDFDEYIAMNFRDGFVLSNENELDDFSTDYLTKEVLDWYSSKLGKTEEPVEKFFIFNQGDLVVFDQTKTIWNHTDEEVKRLAQMYQDKNFWKVPAGAEITPDKIAFYFDNKSYRETFEDVSQMLYERQRKPSKARADKEAMKLFKKYGIGGAWHSDINLVVNAPENVQPFFTNKPRVKGGKVTYSRRIDNPEFLKYYAEPVQINGKWYVKKYNGDEEFIKIEGN